MNSRLIKLLMLSQSPNDNEALAAIRKANEILAEDNKNWENVFEVGDWPAKYEKLRLMYNDLVGRYNTMTEVIRIANTATPKKKKKKKKLFGLF